MFVILQKYDFSSKSQLVDLLRLLNNGCLWYCKSTIFQANHNATVKANLGGSDVCDTAKVRFFKQITTQRCNMHHWWWDVCDTAKVRFFKQITTLGKTKKFDYRCLWYCKSTIFQANHNRIEEAGYNPYDVCDTAKVRFFKQITTAAQPIDNSTEMFVILQKYDFSSKSQP